MTWTSYENAFKEKAKQSLSQEDIDRFLNYAKGIFAKGFPVIFDLEHLSLLLGYNQEYIYRVCNKPVNFYRIFKVPKKNGKERTIAEPLPSLKEIQTWILQNILSKSTPSRFCKAYIKGHSIKSNAKFHRNKKIVLGIDIDNYFPSISITTIKLHFASIGYTEQLADILSRLCCLEGSLPQGSPTSPMLSNLVTKEIDDEIFKVINPLKINYSRYADDLTFSGSFDVGFVINNVRDILEKSGFTLNDKKIRAQQRNERQLVTGIVVNEKMQVERTKRRKLRQIMYYIEKYGYEGHFRHVNIRKKNYIGHLIGIANYILFVNPKDDQVRGYLERLHKIRKQL